MLLYCAGKYHETMYPMDIILPQVKPLQFYFVSRHPFEVEAKIRPFDSLSRSIWAAFSFNYLTFIVASVLIYGLLKPYLRNVEGAKILIRNFFETLFDPSGLYWQRVIKAGKLFRILIAFNFWTFNVLYGMNLRAALISQEFEFEINGWANLTDWKTHFSVLEGHEGWIINVTPNWVQEYLYLYNRYVRVDSSVRYWFKDRKRPLYSFVDSNDDTVVMDSIDVMTNYESPSQLVLMMTGYKYIFNSDLDIP